MLSIINLLFLGTERVIDVLPMDGGSAEEGTSTIVRVLQDWGVTAEHLVGGAFDTTNTNSGAHRGIKARLERAFGKRLIHIYCRHHVYER